MTDGPLLDPDCVAGKHSSCVGGPCECACHPSQPEAGAASLWATLRKALAVRLPSLVLRAHPEVIRALRDIGDNGSEPWPAYGPSAIRPHIDLEADASLPPGGWVLLRDGEEAASGTLRTTFQPGAALAHGPDGWQEAVDLMDVQILPPAIPPSQHAGPFSLDGDYLTGPWRYMR